MIIVLVKQNQLLAWEPTKHFTGVYGACHWRLEYKGHDALGFRLFHISVTRNGQFWFDGDGWAAGAQFKSPAYIAENEINWAALTEDLEDDYE